MNIKDENRLIKFDADYAYNECARRAASRNIELDYVIERFLLEFRKTAKSHGYLID